MKRFKTVTLGCKVNQCESSALAHLLEERGLEKSEHQQDADLVIINTCTVTGRAAMQSRQTVRQMVRQNPNATIVVTGCYAQTAPDDITAIEGVDLIVGHDDKLRIAELVDVRQREKASPPLLIWQPINNACDFSSLPSVSREERTRAFLKIQDGCNTRCTYCIVPHARGKSRSMPVEDVHRHMAQLAAEGLHEVVLTGIHLGAYGADLQPKTSFTNLLREMVDKASVDRVRISSIEPTEIDDQLVELIRGAGGRICRHFHIPLQSGDNRILRRMGRPYSREQFARIVQGVVDAIPDVAIGVDVMAGFPGEDQDAFDNTYGLLETLPITYLHVFPYSPRPGTPAAGYKNKVPERVTKERCHRLRQLGLVKQVAFYRAMVGKTFDVLIETVPDQENTNARGWSDNYLQIEVPSTGICENTLVKVTVQEIVTTDSAVDCAIGGVRTSVIT